MKFKNHAERMQHPQAKIISTHLWNNSQTVWKTSDENNLEFPDPLISLIQKIQSNAHELLDYIAINKSDLKKFRQKVALIIVLSNLELDSQSLDRINALLDFSDEIFFKLSAEAGNPRLMKLMFDRNTESTWKNKMIDFYEHAVFRWAAAFGHLKVLDYLSKQAPHKMQAMIAAKSYEPFHNAAAYGHVEVLDYLLTQAPDKLKSMIAANNYQAFLRAASNGHQSVLRYLADKAPDKLQAMIEADDYQAFREAASNGYLSILEYLAEQAPDKLQAMIEGNNYGAFRNAAANGHLPILHFLEERVPDKIQAMITEDCGHAFSIAAINGHLSVLRYLAEKAPDRLQPMITSYDYCAFHLAALHHHDDVVHFLLFNAAAFAYAESHEHEYGQYTTPFIFECLDDLHRRKAEYDEVSISVTPAEAKQLFYLARALIRRHLGQDDLRLVLEIPAVKELAHQAITPNHPNELLRLAALLGNQEASDYLLTIPEVRREAEANNFYLDEYQGRINLRTMAQDRESSMIALSQEESVRLQGLKNHYFDKDKSDPNQILEELRDLLIKRYEENPARIGLDDLKGEIKTLALPCGWDEFNALCLPAKEKQAALEGYYKNKNHTAWRFLAKPNPWIYPYALYTSQNDRGQWSSFEDYAELIAVLFLAAKDEKTPGIDGYSVETRVTQFIDELALIGRAHNWDNKSASQQEYDDLQGDKPSCYSGTKRRLFQSVQGHPLLKQLTSDILQQELREFVWQHFQKVITEKNHPALCTIWQKSIDIEELTNEERTILSETNISNEDQLAWLQKLELKYGNQVKHYESFLLQKFNLSERDSHFLHFSYLDIERLLKSKVFQEEDYKASLDTATKYSLDTNISERFFNQKANQNNNNNNSITYPL